MQGKHRKKAINTIRDVLRGASGKVPQLDLLRIWDSGASQGMTDRSLVSSDASVKGKKNIMHTGNGPVISDMYESIVVADGDGALLTNADIDGDVDVVNDDGHGAMTMLHNDDYDDDV